MSMSTERHAQDRLTRRGSDRPTPCGSEPASGVTAALGRPEVFVELGGQIGLEVVAPWLTIGIGCACLSAGGPR